ncbi:MAG: exo-alpha-sialidase [Candidatus Omnitrophica bacterium]|nr:exo-alpha-sialidase [Candidatus Omnitrophota bacterium]
MKYRVLIFACVSIFSVAQAEEDVFKADVYIQGQNDVDTYRIPSLLVTPKGALLAFAEARQDNGADHGHLETVVRRSEDSGKTWGPIQVVASDGENAVQNPTPVIDRETGTIWMCLIRTSTEKYKNQKDLRNATEPSRSIWIVHSKDDGNTWSEPMDITDDVYRPDCVEAVPGPGVGIQLESGRLLFPSYCRLLDDPYSHCFSIYSDDGGKTWRSGEITGPKMNECQAVQLSDGSVLVNMRSYRKNGVRAIATSQNGGVSWSEVVDDPALIEPVCQASLIAYDKVKKDGVHPLLFSNPARSEHDDRNELTVRVSYDEGKTWPVAKCIEPGFAAYSCLAVLPNGDIGCLYEQAIKEGYDSIAFARFSYDWLTDQKEGN